MGRIILVTGGARSGKSGHAERLAAEIGGSIAYIATAQALDPEMEDRIARHRAQRPTAWQTFEAQLVPSAVVQAEGQRHDCILLDCLTVLATNRILHQDLDWDRATAAQMAAVEADVLAEIEALLTASAHSAGTLIAVTNEVGFGIVPATRLARFFRDCAGRVNQRMAAVADEVHLVVSGIPVRIKGG